MSAFASRNLRVIYAPALHYVLVVSEQGDRNEEVGESHPRCSRDGPDLGRGMGNHWRADRDARGSG